MDQIRIVLSTACLLLLPACNGDAVAPTSPSATSNNTTHDVQSDVLLNDMQLPPEVPIATADNITRTHHHHLYVLDLFNNDLETRGLPMKIDKVTNGSQGTVEILNYRRVVYTLQDDRQCMRNGPDGFMYRNINEDGQKSKMVNVTFGVTNQPPTANPDPEGRDAFLITQNSTYEFHGVIQLLENDTDPDGDHVRFIRAKAVEGTRGVVAPHPDPNNKRQFLYTAPETTGSDVIGYEITDDCGDSQVITGEINIDVVQRPKAIGDSATTPFNTPVTLNVLANDSDPDGDPLEVRLFTDPPHGTVSCSEDGTCTYTPDDGFTGEDIFEYEAQNPEGGTDRARVVIRVLPPS